MSHDTAQTPRVAPSRWGLALAGALAVVCYLRALRLDFALDDEVLIVANTRLGEWSYARGVLTSLWRPLKHLSFMLDHAVWGTQAYGYHLTNLVLHLAATLALVVLFTRLTAHPRLAAVAGALFAVHPIHVEAVANIANRKESMATLFYALAFLACLRLLRSLTWLPLAFVGYAAALASKESAAVMLPVMFVAYAWGWREPRATREERRRLLAFVIPVALAPIAVLAASATARAEVAAWLTPRQVRWITANDAASLTPLAVNAPRVLVEDMRLLLWPRPFTIHHRVDLVAASDLRVWVALAIIAGVVALIVRTRRTTPWFGFGLLWMLINLVPFLNLIPLTWWFVAERFLYLPSAGLCLALAALCARLYTGAWVSHARWRRHAVLAALALLVVVSGLATMRRIPAFRNSLMVMETALNADPRDWRTRYWLCLTLKNMGYAEDAEDQCRRSAGLKPGYPLSHLELARFALTRGDLRRAEDEAKKAYDLDAFPDYTAATLARVYTSQGRVLEAVALSEEAARAKPHDIEIERRLAEAYARAGRHDEAQAAVARLLARHGDDPDSLVAAGRVAALGGRHDEALNHLRRAIDLDPFHVEAMLAAAEEEVATDHDDEARRFFEQALETPQGKQRRKEIEARLKALDEAVEPSRP